MDLKRIEELLDKYYNGETTLAEEKVLKDFFNQESVPAKLKEQQMQFRFYANAQTEGIGDPLEERLASIHKTKARIIPFFNYSNRFKAISAIAAGLLLIIGVSLLLVRDTLFNNKGNCGTYNVPMTAYVQTKRALLLVASKLNTGNRNLTKISKLNEMQNFLTKTNKAK